MSHKAGFINIIGNPNVGKSTLMNALLGERLSIITSKAQTTRHRIIGIINEDDYQMVLSDTPGIVKPSYKLHESMMRFIESALLDADVFLYITDIYEMDVEESIKEKLNKSSLPLIVAINKIDQDSKVNILEVEQYYRDSFPKAELIKISALKDINIDELLKKLIELLPESPPYFPKDELTDRPLRFFISEIIREKIFLFYKKEVPYSTEVIVNEYKEKEELVYIQATIYVSRETQKMILIGKNGSALKKTGTAARKDIEKFIEQKVYLDLSVKVSKDWRDKPQQLKRFGYEI